MNRKKIKEEARNIIKGNLWEILTPFLIITLISLGISILGLLLFGKDIDKIQSFESFLSIALIPMEYGSIVFLIKYVRKEKTDYTEIFHHYNKFWPVFCLSFLTGLFIMLGCFLLIIPGIIFAISFNFVYYVMADGEENSMECIRKSTKLMKGYKWDYVVFILSFLGWILLGLITFGLAYIYVVPYMNIAETLYYEELKKIN